jgi:hypothetical protein
MMDTTTLRTATDLEREAEQKAANARLYETLLRENEAADRALDFYTRTLAEPDVDTEIAQNLLEAAMRLSDQHVTRGAGLRPGGYILRTLIVEEIGHVITKAKSARAAFVNRMPEIELRAAEARRALDQFVARNS